jgi:hypothetical protein
LFWRQRGDESFRPFTPADYDAVRRRFADAERLALLER